MSEEWQRRVCQELGLRFVCANACDEGGPNVQLRHPTFGHRIIGDGNCLFRAFSYIITGAEDQHFELRCRIVEHFKSVDYRLIETAITAPTVQEYIANSGVVAEMFVLASMVGANVYSYRMQNYFFEICTPGVVIHPDNYGAQSMYILYTGDHFNVMLSQEPGMVHVYVYRSYKSSTSLQVHHMLQTTKFNILLGDCGQTHLYTHLKCVYTCTCVSPLRWSTLCVYMNVYLIVCTGQCNTTLSGIQPTETASDTAIAGPLELGDSILHQQHWYMYMQVM